MFKNKLKILLFLICISAILNPLTVNASIPILENGEALSDLNSTADKYGYAISEDPEDIKKIRMNITKTIIQHILGLLGIIFLILIIWGGYDWMFSGGNEEKVGKAKLRIRMAINGLIIILAAYVITSFIFTSLAQNTIQT